MCVFFNWEKEKEISKWKKESEGLKKRLEGIQVWENEEYKEIGILGNVW